MEKIHVPHLLKLTHQQARLEVDQFITDFASLTPVRGWLQVKHRGNFLEVFTKVEAIVTLDCDRCLQQYNYKLQVNHQEILLLEDTDPEEQPLELELESEDLVDTISPTGHFDPQNWIYEQLCLALPSKQLCSATCQGIAVVDNPDDETIDRRWGALEILKKQLF
jgi:uncharacterized protein